MLGTLDIDVPPDHGTLLIDPNNLGKTRTSRHAIEVYTPF
jgi:hypothetical protein